MIKVNNLSFAYAGKIVLDGVNLEIKAGQFVALCGPNGSGKSTLLKLLSGFLRPSSGTVYFENGNISDVTAKEKARKIAFMPSEIKVPYSFTALDIVVMGRYARSRSFGDFDAHDYRAALDVMEKFGILALAKRPIHSLSTGEYQKMFLAQNIVQDPLLFLLDEPASHLDIKGQEELFSLLKSSCRAKGITAVLVSHDVNTPVKYADRMILLNKGAVLCDGAPKDVLTAKNMIAAYGVEGDVVIHNRLPYFITK